MNPSLAEAPRSQSVPLPLVKPYVAYILLGINIIIFILQSLTPDIVIDGVSISPWTLYGAKINEFIVQGEYWRLITPMFLHANLLHIAFNSYALYIFGTQVEAIFGRTRFIAIYFLAGIGGSVMSFIFSPNPSVGASGAIFGLIGANLVYFYNNRQAFGEMGRRRLMDMLTIAGINLFIGLSPGIDNWGHVGGLIGGVTVCLFIAPQWRVEVEPITGKPTLFDDHQLNVWRGCGILAVASALLVITLFVSALRW